jgi:hypothetical protein
LESFDRCGNFLDDHQICLVTGPTASEREFRKSQADDVIRLQSQHRRRIPWKHVFSSLQSKLPEDNGMLIRWFRRQNPSAAQ